MHQAQASPRGRATRRRRLAVVLSLASLVSACSGAQSALEPGGLQAARIARLFWWMTAGSVIIWLLVVGLATYALYAAPRRDADRSGRFLIVGGGVVFPTIILTIVLIYGLAMLPDFLEIAPEGSLRIVVSGEQWWWRVRYLPEGQAPVDLANELRLPVGVPVELELESPDVIHSFWIPSLAGKVDMIPGRTTRLRLQATRTGTYRGVCAEYCGTAHALMAFPVVVQHPVEFAAWLEAAGRPAAPPVEPMPRLGQVFFLQNGCGACHTIRGTPAAGVVGPDLTHVGGRLSLGAGIMGNEASELYQWITHPELLKPGVHMPHFGMLPEPERRAMASYLESLK